MAGQLPFGVRYTCGVNFFHIALCIGVGLFVGGVLALFALRPEVSAESPDVLPLWVAPLVMFFFLIPAGLLYWLNQCLEALNPNGRVWGIIVSCVGLLSFPLGTILYGIALYYMLLDEETKVAFGAG